MHKAIKKTVRQYQQKPTIRINLQVAWPLTSLTTPKSYVSVFFRHFFTLFVKTNIIKTIWYHIDSNCCFLWISISLQKIGRKPMKLSEVLCLNGWYAVCIYSFAWISFFFFDHLFSPWRVGGWGILQPVIGICKSLFWNNLSHDAFIAKLSLRTMYPKQT